MKNGTKPRRAGKIILIVVLVAAILAGGTFGAIRIMDSRSGEVNVYPVADFSTSGDWIGGGETDGVVSTDKMQTIYLSSTQQITEIYVEEGQEIHVGDPILTFDTTLSDIELERQGIKVRQLRIDIENTEKELAEINTYRIGSPQVYTPTYTVPTYASAPYMPYDRAPKALGTLEDPLIWLWNDDCVLDESFFLRIAALAAANREAAREGGDKPVGTLPPVETLPPEETESPDDTAAPEETPAPEYTEAPIETPVPVNTPEPTPEVTPTPVPTPEVTPTPVPTPTPEPEPTPVPEEDPEEGSEEDESAAAPYAGDRLLRAVQAHSVLRAPDGASEELPDGIDDPCIYIVFEVRTSDSPQGDIERVWELALTVNPETGDWSARIITPYYDPGDDGSSYVDYDDYYVDTNIYYSAAEIAQMKAECNQKLKDLRLDLKSAELEYSRLEYELAGGEVVSKIDGVVKTVRDPEDALAENRPVVVVSGGGGYYVTAVLGEFDLGTMHIGDTVTVQSWENYQVLEGVITEISEYPDESNQYWYYSEGNQNVSVYTFRVFIDENAELREGEYVSITYSGSGGEDGGLYLELPFIREENGRSYVYTVGEDGKLEKRYLRTGKNLWGSYVEILDGLTIDDYVAFPYGRQTKDGARVRYADSSELWSSMYYGIG